MLGIFRRAAVVVACVLAVGAAGGAAYALVPWEPTHGGTAATGVPARPGPLRLVAWPPEGAQDIPLETPISVEVENGHLRSLEVTSPEGFPIAGYLVNDATRWLTRTRLAPGTTYTVRAKVTSDRGSTRAHEWAFTTTVPTGALGARVVPGDDEVVGVGQPISVRFTSAVQNKAAVEERMLVRTSVPVEGAWRWMNDREAHWRPRDYWPAGTEVWFDADLEGVDAGDGVYGDVHRTAHFRIGDAHVSIADTNTHTLTVYENGAVIKVFPMSAGKPTFPTMSGKHLVLGKSPVVVMDSSTNGIPIDSAEGYLTTVYWDTQISTTGEYVHAAPWSVSSQGRANVSHGCINLSTENAKWFFEWSRRGDIVEVLGTSKPPNQDAAVVDWKLPYDEWRTGSALYDPTPAGRVRLT